ncbi:MAG: ATP-binding cassette domain-containing protein [Clostridia bacterium]|nr:ATP-binding cassette domain-containing protein [Clostridia bacterium]
MDISSESVKTPNGAKSYVIETKSLTKRFANKVAVNCVNMHVERGAIYGLIGKNGAGKTTAMKMLLGILPPTEGEITLFGSSDLANERKRIGSLIEAPGIYNNCTAKENMKRFAILSGGTDEEITDLLKLVGLGDVGNKKAGAFSLGMKQRLGIAISLIGSPELLILDEPINGLDPAGIKEIRDLILKLNKERGVTFMISSHLLDELGKIATDYGIINDGKLVEEISASELAARCRDGLKIVVDDVEKAVALLEGKGFTDYKVKKGVLVLHEGIDRSAEINTLLVSGGLKVSELSVHSNGFEGYFIKRLGH